MERNGEMVLVILGNGEKVDFLGYKKKRVGTMDGCDGPDPLSELSYEMAEFYGR